MWQRSHDISLCRNIWNWINQQSKYPESSKQVSFPVPFIPVLRSCRTVQNAGKHKRNMCRFTPISLTFTKVHLHRLQDKTLPESFTAKNITLRMINLCQKIYFRLPWGLIGRNKLSTSFHWNIINNWKAAYWLIKYIFLRVSFFPLCSFISGLLSNSK